MRKISSINHVEKKVSGAGKDYVVIHITDDQQDEAEIYVGVGDRITVYFDDKYNKTKAEKIHGRQAPSIKSQD